MCPSFQVLSKTLCTFNLHLLCCQLARQVKQRGLTWQYGELWVERLIGEFKRRTKYRTHGQPEVTMVNDYLMRCALQQARLAEHGQELQTWEQFKEAKKLAAAVARGASLDPASAAEGKLLDAGKKLGGRNLARVLTEELQDRIWVAMQDAWVGSEDEWLLHAWNDSWDKVVFFQHARAFTPEGLYITSSSYLRSRTRDGTWIWVSYTTDAGGEQPHAAQVRFFLRLHLPAAETNDVQVDDIRIAVCDFLPFKQPYTDSDICEVVLIGQEKSGREDTFSGRSNMDYPVLLQKIEAPLFVHRYKGGNGEKLLAFAPLRFKTGGARQAHY